MISINDALKIINRFPVGTKVETVSLFDALGRVLAEEVVSPVNIPPFAKSAMDGYAIDSEDNSRQFFIRETIPAGFDPGIELQKGECAKIMTGAMVPRGANRVIRREVTRERDGFMLVTDIDKGSNICLKGEDIAAGDTVFNAGQYLDPQHVGVIASVGFDRVRVFLKPLVGIVTTGNEIIAPGEELQPGKIYNSNSYSMGCQYLKYGCDIRYQGMVGDSREEIRAAVRAMLKTCDVVVISGGVSVGDFDFVPRVLKKLGFTTEFEKVAIKPGKPTVFATMDHKVAFGVPGNPVSTFVVNEIFVKPLLFRMMGRKLPFPFVRGKLAEDLKVKKSDRTSFIPVRVTAGRVETLEYHGSAHLLALTRANGLLEIPRQGQDLEKGTQVDVRSI